MRIFTGFLLLCLLNTLSVFGTSSRYWVNGSGSWNDSNQWALTSGGKAGAPVPTSSENVFFDENSFAREGETVRITGTAECRNLHWRNTGKSPVLVGNRRSALQVHGTMIIDDYLDNQFDGRIVLTSDSPQNIFYAVTEFKSDIIFSGDGTWQLNSPLKTTGRLEVEKVNLQPEGNRIITRSFTGSREQEEILSINEPVGFSLKGTSSDLAATAVGSTVTCYGSCDGTAEVTGVTGGVPPYDYQWFDLAANPIPGATSPSISDLCAGTYTVRVRDSNTPIRNSVFVQVDVLNPPNIGIPDIDRAHVSCHNANDGIIQVNAFGGTGALAYSIDGGATFFPTNLFTGLSAGDYDIVVRDANNCTRFYLDNPVTILNPSAIVIDSESKTDVTGCFGNTNGSVTVTASGGTGVLTYTLNPLSISNTTGVFSNLPAGTYTVDVTDENSCGPESTGNMIITQPPQLLITGISHTNVNCAGEAEGSITVTATGGTGTIYFTLNPGAITNTTGFFNNLVAGAYTVSVTDDNACGPFATGDIEITEPDPIQITGSSKTDITCNTADDGEITVTATGGTGVLTYTLSPGAVSNTAGIFTGLSAGSYVVSVTDENLCGPFNTAAIDIIEPAAITITSAIPAGTSCFGGSDGSLTVVATGGTGVLTYTLNPGAISNTTGVFSGLFAGAYSVSVTDENTCGPVSTGSIDVTEPPEIQITGSAHTDISCNGLTDGTITVTANGGTGTLSYTLNPGAETNTTGVFTGLAANSYTVSVTDDNGCGPFTTAAIEILEPPAIQITGSSKTDITCNGLTDGTITVTATGGSGTLTYIINPGAVSNTTGLFTGLSAGSYTVSVTDANGCGPENTAPIEIIEPSAIQITGSSKTDISCNGLTDGAITVTATGGVGTLVYTLNPGAVSNTTGIFTNLGANTYTVSVSDDNSCGPVSTGNIEIIEPPAIQITSENSTNVSCNGGSDGSITVVASGGTSTLTYILNPGSVSNTTGIFSGLAAGFYTVSVTDVNACGPVTTGSIEITQPPVISITGENKTDITCFGLTDGTITVTATGGTGTLSYTITPGAVSNSTGIFTNLGPGDYTVSVTDVNGCGPVVSNSIEVVEPDEILFTGVVKTDISCNGETDGTITATATGGIAPLVYTILPLGISNSTGIFEFLPADTYTVQVDDFNNCGPVNSAPVTIIEPDEITAVVTVTDAVCHGTATGIIEITASDGIPPYNYSVDGGLNYQAGNLFPALTAGSYHVFVRDNNGCTKDAGIFMISEPDPVTFTYNSTNITCYGEADGTIEFTAAGGTPPYEYSIYGNDPFEYQAGNTFINLGPDTYELIVRDANGCLSASFFVTLEDPDQIFVGFNAPAITTCFGDPGSITLTGTGGSGSLEYSISTTQFVPGAWQASGEFNNLQGGVPYYGFVRDIVTGCIAYANDGNSITINQPSEIIYTVTSVTHVLGCSYDTTGEIRISLPTGGSPPYTYFIDGVSNGTSRVFSNLAIGSYLIEAVDTRGCRKPTNLDINGPAPIVYDSFVKTDVETCFGDNSGSIILSASGGTGVLSYILNGGTPQANGNFTNLVAGDYHVEVRDDNACFIDSTLTITQPPLMNISVTKTNVNCFGADDGTITVIITGGVEPYAYSINNGLNYVGEGNFTNLAPGVYSVVGRDANGCIQHGGNITIYEPALLTIAGELVVDPTNCPGDPGNGSITITASGGTAPLQYSIDGGTSYFSNGGLFTDLPSGNYQVSVIDSKGCITAGSDLTLTGVPPIVLDITKMDISCYGETDGGITILASGGGGTFEYSINNGIDYFASGIFTSLPAGDYEILVIDNLGCTQSGGTISIVEPDVLSIDNVQITHVIEGGPADAGALDIIVSGGTPAYEYSIDGGLNFFASSNFTGLTVGTYNIVVRDSRGCEDTTTADINEVPPYTVVIDVTDVSCFGLSDGEIILSATDGAEPFEYSIDGGLNYFLSGIFTDLTAGIYPVRIRDAGGAVYSTNVTVNQPSEILITGITTDATCNLSTDDGSVTINVSGGTAPYAYLWSDGSPNKDIPNAYGGNYTVTVTDDSGCFKEANFFVNWIHEVTVDLGDDFAVCPDTEVLLNASYTQSGSSIAFSWSGNPSEVIDPVQDPTVNPVFPSSIYTVTATDENGCFATSGVQVNVYDVPEISAGDSVTVQSGESVTLTASPDLFVSYIWSPAEGLNTTSGISVISTPSAPITYTVTGTTAEGCISTADVFVKLALPIKPMSGFTPNGDSVNDKWDIVNAVDYPNILVEVFNRYGQKVFSSKGYSDDQRWDGNYKGKPLPVGTYYFVIVLNDSFGTKPITGPVTIVR
jgi:large repetitive protein